jgi:hypothetical protein
LKNFLLAKSLEGSEELVMYEEASSLKAQKGLLAKTK